MKEKRDKLLRRSTVLDPMRRMGPRGQFWFPSFYWGRGLHLVPMRCMGTVLLIRRISIFSFIVKTENGHPVEDGEG